ncbi:hypothetical protein ABT282_36160 [Streptomyces sp. NPDC000927]|uniref:hypothetical protein n=1 Tax=Streptomyces sp. NPDC000927 TaxID=3154371 RepID=UPI00331D6F49
MRRTERLRSTLAAVGLALAGRAGAKVFGASVSRGTVLRLVEALLWSSVMASRPAYYTYRACELHHVA